MLGEAPRLFLERNHSAAMITIARSGFPRPVRVGVALVDGKLWSSGVQGRVRTPRLRRDPRCSVFVFEQGGYAWLALETTVSILEGPDAPSLTDTDHSGSADWAETTAAVFEVSALLTTSPSHASAPD